MISSIEETINLYLTAWNSKKPEDFKAAFAKCWAEDATYTDPNFELTGGLDSIVELAKSSLEKFPIRTFYIVTPPQYHHNAGLYAWGVDLSDQSRVGYDYFEFNEEKKITKLVSFFPPLK